MHPRRFNTYEQEQQHLENLMKQCLLEDELDLEEIVVYDDEPESDEEDNLETQSIHSDTEQEISEIEDNLEFQRRGATFIGKNNETIWSKHPIPRPGKTGAENLVKHLPGAKMPVKNKKTELEIWTHFFPDTTLDMIVEHTNRHIQANRDNYQRERDAKDTDRIEIKAFHWAFIFSWHSKIQSPES